MVLINRKDNKKNIKNIKNKKGIITFFLETYQEIKKVSWPTRKYTFNSTIVVLVTVFVFSVFVTIVDFAFDGLMRFII